MAEVLRGLLIDYRNMLAC